MRGGYEKVAALFLNCGIHKQLGVARHFCQWKQRPMARSWRSEETSKGNSENPTEVRDCRPFFSLHMK